MPTSFTASLASEYELLFDSCLIPPARQAAVATIATRIAASKARYQTVGDPLGIPWCAIGLIHAMESSLDFSTHLHNGDPLTARTVHVPAGRPPTGSPPFTWEQSAADALALRGLPRWKDWTTPGLLYQLEGYNGFGYRSVKPPIPTPYLWSFSNHYTAGKYVADGKYSPTAVSQQCGAATILKRLVQSGAVQLPGPRVLQLANPDLVGPDVVDAQTLLTTSPFGNFQPGVIDGDFGQTTSDAVKRAKLALGFPQSAVNGTFGSVLAAYLKGEKPLPPAYQTARDQRLAASAATEDGIRAQIVQWALWGVTNNARIAYGQGSTRFSALGTPGSLPLAVDCSAFATLCYAWAGAPNPNFRGKSSAAAGGFTGTLLSHCKRVPQGGTKPGDLVVWTSPSKPNGSHAAVIVATGANPMLVSHGSDAGPVKVKFSDEDAIQRKLNGGTPTAAFLSAF